MGWPSREEVIRQMGLDTSQSMEAPDLHNLLSCLEDQKEIGIDQPEVPGRTCLYAIAARSMYRYTFHTASEPYYDTKRKALWYLGRKVPKKNEFPDLDIRARYNILRKGRWLFVYPNPNHERPKRLLQYDMQDAMHRRSFVDVRRWTEMRAQKYKSNLQAPPKHKDLLRVQKS